MTTLEAPAFPTGSAGLGPIVKRWNVDEYHKMIDLGLIVEGAPIELIDGILVYKDRRDSGGSAMTHGPRHVLAVAQLVELNARLTPAQHHLRIQSPVVIGPNHEPEPDGLILPGRPIQYQGRIPAAREARVAIEVADSSLFTDRTVKLRMYATAAIPVYWIVNLRENVIEVYEHPDLLAGAYGDHRDYRRGDSFELELPGSGSLTVAVTEIIAD
ncbi:MAG: Uma2 family endonuclease [Planctomycetaceae bacterium]|nr:Uma2 family endonuclease [Planctomycetaceae bacterium]